MADCELDLDRFLPYRLSVLSNTVSAAIAREYAERFDLGVTEWRVIAVLGRFPGLSANGVAERTAMDKVAVSRALSRLIAAGRVRREVHGADRRRSVLALSSRGQRVYRQIAPLALDCERRLLSVLDAEERAWLERIVERLRGAGVAALARAAHEDVPR